MTVYRIIIIPDFNQLGCEILGIVFTQFISGKSIYERLEKTTRSFEKSEEIVLSIGDQNKGFSLNFCQNYTRFSEINAKRIDTFGEIGILGREFPHEVIFPIQSSTFRKFFNFGELLMEHFTLTTVNQTEKKPKILRNNSQIQLTTKEKQVIEEIIKNPTEKINVSSTII